MTETKSPARTLAEAMERARRAVFDAGYYADRKALEVNNKALLDALIELSDEAAKEAWPCVDLHAPKWLREVRDGKPAK